MKSRMAVLTFLMVGLLLWVGALAAAPVEANGGPAAGSLEEPTGNNFEATTVDFQTIYVSTSGAGKMGALRYASADILAYDVATSRRPTTEKPCFHVHCAAHRRRGCYT